MDSYTRVIQSHDIFVNYGTIRWSIQYNGSYYNDLVGVSSVEVNGMYFIYSAPGFGVSPHTIVDETGIIRNG